MINADSNAIDGIVQQVNGLHYPEHPDGERRLIRWLYESQNGLLEIAEDDIKKLHAALIDYWQPRRFISQV